MGASNQFLLNHLTRTDMIMAKNGTEALVTNLPRCNFFHTDPNTPAEYDFRTAGGSWANGCERHWGMHRMHTDLGIGKGQKLVVAKTTVPNNEHDSSDLV